MNDRSGGFSVIETLIALILLSSVLVALGTNFAAGWRGIAAADADARALSLAHSEITREGVEWSLAAGSRSGTTSDGLKFIVTTTPYQLPDVVLTQTRPLAYWVTVVVHRPWRPAGTGRPIRLLTLKRVEAP